MAAAGLAAIVSADVCANLHPFGGAIVHSLCPTCIRKSVVTVHASSSDSHFGCEGCAGGSGAAIGADGGGTDAIGAEWLHPASDALKAETVKNRAKLRHISLRSGRESGAWRHCVIPVRVAS